MPSSVHPMCTEANERMGATPKICLHLHPKRIRKIKCLQGTNILANHVSVTAQEE